MMTQNVRDWIDILSCALRGEAPLLAGRQLEGIAAFASRHSLSALMLSALSHGRAGVPEEEYRKLEQNALQSLYRLSGLDGERQALEDFLEAQGIWYMPLKGVILQELYPEYGTREMCDNDILYDASARERVIRFFRDRGYRVKRVEGGADDAFTKAPSLNFEMHRSLVSDCEDPRWAAYYRDLPQRLEQVPGRQFARRFRDEDFYVYLVLHITKHLRKGGTGLRCLADCHVWLQSKGSSMDWAQIADAVRTLGIEHEEQLLRSLTRKLFSAPEDGAASALTEQEQALLSYLLDSGTYGSYAHIMENKLRSQSVPKYIFRRLFPPMSWYRDNVPFFYRHKVLLPAFWLWRMGNYLIRKPAKVRLELKRLFGKKSS